MKMISRLVSGKTIAIYNWFTPKRVGIGMFFIAILMLTPWLGLTDFNTKGEPREAVVSMSMLNQNDWILPLNNDIDIPYKPMMYHWVGTITAIMLNDGEVNEFTARFPSALAFSLIVGMTCWFYSRYTKFKWEPLLAGAILLTCFEMHRSGISARVDMMLTFWMCASFFLLYRWWERERSGVYRRFLNRIPWLAILCMSGGALSKGPVGILLPCLVMGLFMLLKGEKLLRTTGWMLMLGLLSTVLPLAWYYAAWKQGGDAFLSLVMEENFGRMTGTMTYESHSNPWHYNFWITAAGFLPWTLLALAGGFAMLLRKGRGRRLEKRTVRHYGFKWKGSDAGLYSLTALTAIMIFFCLPASKRSVYLMPCYPFIAWWGARWFVWLGKNGYEIAIRIFGNIMAGLAILIEILFVVIKLLPPATITFNGRKAAVNHAILDSLADTGCIAWITVTLLFAAGVLWFAWKGKRRSPTGMLMYECILCGTLFLAMDAGLQPPVLNTKSLKEEAETVRMLSEGKEVYEFIEFGENSSANKYHFFELNFYLGDKMKNFVRHNPDGGILAIPTSDVARWLPEFENNGYRFYLLYTIDRPNRKEKISLYEFTKDQ